LARQIACLCRVIVAGHFQIYFRIEGGGFLT
jgi:hypothetical protein